jgi:hypothetical protein
MTAKIIRLPGLESDINRNKAYTCMSVYIGETVTVVRLTKTKWGVLNKYDGFRTNLTGYVHGYNHTASEVGWYLYELGLWSEAQALAFSKQQHEESQRISKEIEVKKAMAVLKDNGYIVRNGEIQIWAKIKNSPLRKE